MRRRPHARSGDFTGLERWSDGQLSAKEMADALTRYGSDFVYPTDAQQISRTHFYDVSEERTWFAVDTPLWSIYGPTDLELQLEIKQTDSGEYSLYVRDIRVP